MNLSLPWGKEEITIDLPETWQPPRVLSPASLAPAQDPDAEVRRSLSEPIGLPPLRDLYKPGMRLAVVVDDGSRPTPVSSLLPRALEELRSAGLKSEDVTIIPALGLHRPMEAGELAQRCGLGDFASLRWVNPACDDPASLANLGTTSRGTPVWINKIVADADLVVSIGCIEPHMIASFGGGYKNIVPGVAGRPTVAHNHSLNCRPDTFNMTGQPIERNPMRLDLEEAAAMVKGTVFIVNAVLDSAKRIVQVVAGEAVAAHREGARISAKMNGVSLDRPADVVITDSHPMDQDLRQGVKALGNTIRAIRRGGTLVTLVRAEEGVGVFGLANRKLPLGRAALRRLAPLLVKVVPRLKLQGMGEEDRFFLYSALQAMRLGELIMVAPTIPEAVKANLPFVRFAATPAEAVEIARRAAPDRAQALVFPFGGITYPVIS
ncbi:MAG: nickel-dependent lactate racemase [Chloroflexi bacterium]|nr:nickel-dependent lactate racemase [Chloroflexota bacterium]